MNKDRQIAEAKKHALLMVAEVILNLFAELTKVLGTSQECS
jgi:hypothetical protein